MIINSLESAAAKAKAGPEDRDMPGEGVRHLAAKLRRKLHKTPPRWQVPCCPCDRQHMVVVLKIIHLVFFSGSSKVASVLGAA